MTISTTAQELQELADELGIDLPYSPEEIAELESLGLVVDLETGEILTVDPDEPIELQPNTPERAGDWN